MDTVVGQCIAAGLSSGNRDEIFREMIISETHSFLKFRKISGNLVKISDILKIKTLKIGKH